MNLRQLRRQLDRIADAIRPDSGDEMIAEDTICVWPGDPDPPDLAGFLARGGFVLRPDEPGPAHPIL
jgi:hypothetical protein